MPKIQPYQSLVSATNVAGGQRKIGNLPRTDMNVLSDIGGEVKNVLAKVERKNLLNEAEEKRQIEKQRNKEERLREREKAKLKTEKYRVQLVTHQGDLKIKAFEEEVALQGSLEGSTDWSTNVQTYTEATNENLQTSLDSIDNSTMLESDKKNFKNDLILDSKIKIHKFDMQNDKNMVTYYTAQDVENLEALDTFTATHDLNTLDSEQTIELQKLRLNYGITKKILGSINHVPNEQTDDMIADMNSSIVNQTINQTFAKHPEEALEIYGEKDKNGNWRYNSNEAPIGSSLDILVLDKNIKALGKAKDKKDAAILQKSRNDYSKIHSNEINLILTGHSDKRASNDEEIRSKYQGEYTEDGDKLLKQIEVAENVVSLVEETQDFNQYNGANIPTLDDLFKEFPDAHKHSELYTKMLEGLNKQVVSNRKQIDADPAGYADTQLKNNISEEAWEEMTEVEKIENRLVWYEQHGVPPHKREIVSQEFLEISSQDLIDKATSNPEDALEEYRALKNMFIDNDLERPLDYWPEAFNLYRNQKGGSLIPPEFEYLEVFKNHPASEKMLIAAWKAGNVTDSTLMKRIKESSSDLDEIMRNQFGDVKNAFATAGAMNITPYNDLDLLIRKLILVEPNKGKSLKEVSEIVYDRMFGENGDFTLYNSDSSDILIPNYTPDGTPRFKDIITNNLEKLDGNEMNFRSMLKEKGNIVIPNKVINRNLGENIFSTAIPTTFTEQETALIQVSRDHMNNGTHLITSDGRVTTVRIIGLGHNGKEYNVPSYMDGQVRSMDYIVNSLNRNNSWDTYPSYNNIKEAESAVLRMKDIINQDGNHSTIQEEIKNSLTVFGDHYDNKSNLATHADGEGIVINMYLENLDTTQPLVTEDGENFKLSFDDPMDFIVDFNSNDDYDSFGVVN